MFFDPRDPFPLPLSETVSYEEKKAHAIEVDKWLGIDTDSIELAIREKYTLVKGDRELWLHKSPQVFSTPYIEIREILEDAGVSKDETVVDLGAGYCRMAHVLAKHFPGVHFAGVEFVGERLEAGRKSLERHAVSLRFQLIEADLGKFDVASLCLSNATYFIYDFGSVSDIQAILSSLSSLASAGRVKVIARGGRVRDLIARHHAWLGEVVTPVHRPNYSLYRSRE